MPSFILQDDGISHILTDSLDALIFDDSSTAITRWDMRPETGGKGMSFLPRSELDNLAIVVIVKGDDFQGGTVVASSASGEMAIMLEDAEPTSGDWSAVTWKTDSTGAVPVYRALGPSPLSAGCTAGSNYGVWMRLTDTAGVSVARVASLLAIY